MKGISGGGGEEAERGFGDCNKDLRELRISGGYVRGETACAVYWAKHRIFKRGGGETQFPNLRFLLQLRHSHFIYVLSWAMAPWVTWDYKFHH